MKSKRGSAWIWIILILILMVLGVGIYFWFFGIEAKIIEKNFNELTFIKVDERNTNEGSDKSGLYRDNSTNNNIHVVISVTNSKDKAKDKIEDINEVVINHKFNKEEKIINKNKIIWTEEYRDNEQGLETIIFWRSGKNVISLDEYLRKSTQNTKGYTNLGSKELLNTYLEKYPSDL